MGGVIQRWKRNDFTSAILIAEKYYSFLSVMNDLKLTEREIQLTAFTAVKGNISNGNARDEFCRIHDTSTPTINNIISKLKKLKVFIKENGKIKVNPAITLDFSQPIVIQISLQTNDSN